MIKIDLKFWDFPLNWKPWFFWVSLHNILSAQYCFFFFFFLLESGISFLIPQWNSRFERGALYIWALSVYLCQHFSNQIPADKWVEQNRWILEDSGQVDFSAAVSVSISQSLFRTLKLHFERIWSPLIPYTIKSKAINKIFSCS